MKNPLEELLISPEEAEKMEKAQRKIVVGQQRIIILTTKEAYGLWVATCEFKHKAITGKLRTKLFDLINNAERNQWTKLLKD